MSALLTKPHEVSANWRRRVCSVSMPGSAVKVGWTLLYGPQHGISYASQERISDETGVDRGDVGKILREFVRIGLIEAVDAADLAAALRGDGQPKADNRLVGYRRLLDPDVVLTADLARSAKPGEAICPSDEVRLKPRKTGTFKKIAGSGPSELHSEIEGAGPPHSHARQVDVAIELPPDFAGTVPPEFEGAGASPYRPQGSEEADAERVRLSPTVVVERSQETLLEDVPTGKASAPEGARQLHGRLESEIEEAFGRALHDHERHRFCDLVDQIGRPAVHARVAAYVEAVQSGATSPLSIARWLRQSGLVGVQHVA